jgi:hypothetical protein
MNSIAAFHMAQALDDERRRWAEKRFEARQHRTTSDEAVKPLSTREWRAIFRFPRLAAAANKG